MPSDASVLIRSSRLPDTRAPLGDLVVLPPRVMMVGASTSDGAFAFMLAFALSLPILGGGEVPGRTANEFPPPRLPAVRRTAFVTFVFVLTITTLGTVLRVGIDPTAERPLWMNAPWAGVAEHLAGPSWLRDLVALAVATAAALVLVPSAGAALRCGALQH